MGSPVEDNFNDSLSQSLLPEQKAKKRDRSQVKIKCVIKIPSFYITLPCSMFVIMFVLVIDILQKTWPSNSK